MGQSGLWDVDGTGMTKIDDPQLARAFVDNINALNVQTGVDALLYSVAFAILPQSVTYPLAFFALIFGALYYIPIPTKV